MSEGKEGSSPEVLAEQELKQLETERDELLEKHSSWLGADTVKALKFAPSQEVVATMQKFMQEKGWETQVAKFISEIAGLDVPANQSGEPEISSIEATEAKTEFAAIQKEAGAEAAAEFVPKFIEIESRIQELEAERQNLGAENQEMAEAA